MKVVQLIISNYLGIKAVDITPDGNVVRIEGKNGAGKSSVIDSIWAAIGGKDDHPKHPIRNGETRRWAHRMNRLLKIKLRKKVVSSDIRTDTIND